MPTDIGQVVVVGGGLSAARTVQQLRRRGYDGRLVVIGAEPHLPYDRPPLSKAVLAGERHDTTLPFDPVALDVDVRLDTWATGLDLQERVVETDRGDLDFDRLVIATGARPVRLPGSGEQLTLRTIDDALSLRDRLRPGARIVVIGASWIGAEVTTSALARGCRVTCLEGGAAPLAQALGTEVGRQFLPWWAGVDLRLGTRVRGVSDGAVFLDDGELIPADLVVTGVGVRPETAWLQGSGLNVDRGVLVDEHLQASTQAVVALGDVAARWSPRYGRLLRVEHWDDAATAGAVAAATLLAHSPDQLRPHDPVPYFWSDQFGHKIQYVGHHGGDDTPVRRESSKVPGSTTTWVDTDERITAVLTVDRPREAAAAQRIIGESRALPRHELVAADAALADCLAR
jgi:3-phenylpropionate/trans-cinnamate dioxygenase ferredoxin reductase component